MWFAGKFSISQWIMGFMLTLEQVDDELNVARDKHGIFCPRIIISWWRHRARSVLDEWTAVLYQHLERCCAGKGIYIFFELVQP